jgi:hypothetical protein
MCIMSQRSIRPPQKLHGTRSGQIKQRARALTLFVERLENRRLLSAALGTGDRSAYAQPETFADLPAAAQQAISSAIGQDQGAYHAASDAAGIRLANPANGFTAQFQAGTLQVSARADHWDMSLEGLGYGGSIEPVEASQTWVNGNRVDSNSRAVYFRLADRKNTQ